MSTKNRSFSDRIINDLVRAVSNDDSLTCFEIIPMPSSENKNSSPVLRGGNTVGIESWVIRHIFPHAHKIIVESTTAKDAEKLAPYLLTINLLNPDMPTAWSRRRELILRRKMSCSNELRLTRLALSRMPKCNEALAHRRWLIAQNLIPGDDMSILMEELSLINIIADRYHSNYHAWTHRQWAMQRFVPTPRRDVPSSLLTVISKRTMCYIFEVSPLTFYLNELETNFQFISTHVSDFSGMHYRQFLLINLFKILRNVINDSKKAVEKQQIDGDVTKHALLCYASVKPEIYDYLSIDNELDTSAYLAKLDHRLTVFDILLSFVLNELKSNTSLNSLYIDHDALWCYRRFIIHSYLALLKELTVECKNDSSAPILGREEEIDLSCMLRTISLNQENNLIKSFDIGNYQSVEKYKIWLEKHGT